jgi:hypothetical protein
MDLGGTLASKLKLTGPTPGRFAPRWIASALRGQFVHTDVAAEPAIPGELPKALPVHYLIGLVLAVGYFLSVGRFGYSANFAAGIAYGIATSVFAWLLMFPAMGFGVFGLRAPPEMTPIWTTAFNHACYGFGLALWTRVLIGRGR